MPRKKPSKKVLGPGKRDGRPPIVVDWDIVESLCKIQCTLGEIAAVLGMHRDTISTHCQAEKGMTFSAYFDEKAQAGRASLRRKQFQLAMGGNVTMCIWLGKQILDQRDKQEVIDTNDPLMDLIKEFQVEHERITLEGVKAPAEVN